MTSIIKVDEIQNKAGSTSLAANKLPDMLSGSAKAWSNLDGTGTSSVIDSFNISGMTDNGTGDYTNNISSNLSNGNYVVTISYGNQTGSWAAQANGQLKYASTPSAGSYSLTTGNSISAALNDFDRIHSAVHGDLA
jgi:hypothetical protein